MDKAKFFASLRRRDSGVFGTSLSQRQVEGIEILLDVCGDLPLAHTANILAQAYRETGGGMYPVKETVYPSSRDKNPSDATVIARLDNAFKKGQLSWVSKPYWRGGMFGRGVIQITHEDNYRKLGRVVGEDLVNTPGLALRLDISAKIAKIGMRDGLFTGKKLSDFEDPNGFNHFFARSIVNGDRNKRDKGSSKTVGELILGYAEAFEQALVSAEYTPFKPIPDPQPPTQPPNDLTRPTGGLLAFLARLFGGRE